MGIGLLREWTPGPAESRSAIDSTQVFTWPPRRGWARRFPIAGAAILACGITVAARGATKSAVEELAIGMFVGTIGGMVLASMGIAHLIAAREVRFTRDRLFIRQLGRPLLELPYCDYQHHWVADLSNPSMVRLLVFGRNRGCTILHPPEWVCVALHEIGRIQREEGWYLPENRDFGVPASRNG